MRLVSSLRIDFYDGFKYRITVLPTYNTRHRIIAQVMFENQHAILSFTIMILNRGARVNWTHKRVGCAFNMSVNSTLMCLLLTVGTNFPSFIIAVSSWPLSDPLATSSRKRSPVEMWVNPYFWTILSHWVPFPHPGPPDNRMRIEKQYNNYSTEGKAMTEIFAIQRIFSARDAEIFVAILYWLIIQLDCV